MSRWERGDGRGIGAGGGAARPHTLVSDDILRALHAALLFFLFVALLACDGAHTRRRGGGTPEC